MTQNELPLDLLPEAWKDEACLNVLYAPLRSSQVNAKDWDNKLDFWKQSIFVYCSHHKRYNVDLSSLQRAFLHKGRTPTCLQMVLREMIVRKELVSIKDFNNMKPSSTSWAGWATDLLIKRPFTWSLDKVKQSIFPIIPDGETYVHMKAAETEARLLLTEISEKSRNKVLELKDVDQFQKYDADTLKILLHHLVCAGELSSRRIDGGNEPRTLVKFGNVKINGGISDSDVDVYMLASTEKILLETIEGLENEIVALVKDAKGHILKGHKQVAKTCLRKKHDIEKRIEARASALYNVQTLQSRVEDAAHDAHILDTYNFALDSLRDNFKDNKLSEESVTNTMIEIGDVLDIHNDIQSTLAQPLGDSDADLEAELAELLASDDTIGGAGKPSNVSPKPKDTSLDNFEKISEQMSALDLPDVPSDESLFNKTATTEL